MPGAKGIRSRSSTFTCTLSEIEWRWSENRTVSLFQIPFHSLPSPAAERHLSLIHPDSYYDALLRM